MPELVERRGAREPLAYVLGEWGFRRLTLTHRRARARPAARDGGRRRALPRARRGSRGAARPRRRRRLGAIALAIADEHPGARVHRRRRLDGCARARARERGAARAAASSCRDGLLEAAEGGWDLVVSNPPYVDHDELPMRCSPRCATGSRASRSSAQGLTRGARPARARARRGSCSRSATGRRPGSPRRSGRSATTTSRSPATWPGASASSRAARVSSTHRRVRLAAGAACAATAAGRASRRATVGELAALAREHAGARARRPDAARAARPRPERRRARTRLRTHVRRSRGAAARSSASSSVDLLGHSHGGGRRGGVRGVAIPRRVRRLVLASTLAALRRRAVGARWRRRWRAGRGEPWYEDARRALRAGAGRRRSREPTTELGDARRARAAVLLRTVRRSTSASTTRMIRDDAPERGCPAALRQRGARDRRPAAGRSRAESSAADAS